VTGLGTSRCLCQRDQGRRVGGSAHGRMRLRLANADRGSKGVCRITVRARPHDRRLMSGEIAPHMAEADAIGRPTRQYWHSDGASLVEPPLTKPGRGRRSRRSPKGMGKRSSKLHRTAFNLPAGWDFAKGIGERPKPASPQVERRAEFFVATHASTAAVQKPSSLCYHVQAQHDQCCRKTATEAEALKAELRCAPHDRLPERSALHPASVVHYPRHASAHSAR